jgi:hypothetical protein
MDLWVVKYANRSRIGDFGAIHWFEAPDPCRPAWRFGDLRRVQAKGGCWLRELNRMRGGLFTAGIRREGSSVSRHGGGANGPKRQEYYGKGGGHNTTTLGLADPTVSFGQLFWSDRWGRAAGLE